jgi:hypothetical protein
VKEPWEGGDAPPWVVAWRQGPWQCELHALTDGWRFHLYFGAELRAVWPCTGEGAFDRAQDLRATLSNPALTASYVPIVL